MPSVPLATTANVSGAGAGKFPSSVPATAMSSSVVTTPSSASSVLTASCSIVTV